VPQPLQYDSAHLDLSGRFFQSSTVAGSPALAAETTVASVTISGDVAITKAAYVLTWLAFTVGTSGTSFRLRIRRDTIAGTTIADSGLVTATAATLVAPTIFGFDTTATGVAQVYVTTLTVTAGSAASTVSAVNTLVVAV
jgi:hypothetical protein